MLSKDNEVVEELVHLLDLCSSEPTTGRYSAFMSYNEGYISYKGHLFKLEHLYGGTVDEPTESFQHGRDNT